MLQRITLICTLLLSSSAFSQTDPHAVPAVDAGLGPCSANFTITGTDGKPVYSAQISVRVHYGRFHRLDLEVGTNVDGKARFTGLPTNPKSGLFFQVEESDRTGSTFDDPSVKCTAQFAVTIRKQNQPQ